MYKTHINESDLDARIYFPNTTEVMPIASAEWLYLFHQALYDAENDVSAMYDAVHGAVSCFFSENPVFRVKEQGGVDIITLERLRWELSRVPLLFKLRATYPTSVIDPTISTKVILAERPGYRFAVGAPQCPKDVFSVVYDSDMDRLVHQKDVFGFYPPSLAASLGLPLTPTWSAETSIIDWMMDFVESERNRRLPRILKQDCPPGWSFYRVSVDGLPTSEPVSIPTDNLEVKAAAGVSESGDSETSKAAAATSKAAAEVVEKAAAMSVDAPKVAAPSFEEASDTEIAIHILKERFRMSSGDPIVRTEVYQTYKTCLSEQAALRNPLSAGKFYRLVREVYPDVLDKTTRIAEKTTRCFVGIQQTQ